MTYFYDTYQEQLDDELLEACKIGDLEKVKSLLTSNEDDDPIANINPETWHTPLGEACWYGYLDIVKYLLTSPDLKVHANMFDRGSRCLVYAAYEGHLDIVEYLLTSDDFKQHIDINKGGEAEERVLDTACSKGRLEIVKFLMDSSKINQSPNIDSLESAIYSCFQERNLEIIQYFIFEEKREILGIIKKQLLEVDSDFGKEVQKMVDQKELIISLNSELQTNLNSVKRSKL